MIGSTLATGWANKKEKMINTEVYSLQKKFWWGVASHLPRKKKKQPGENPVGQNPSLAN